MICSGRKRRQKPSAHNKIDQKENVSCQDEWRFSFFITWFIAVTDRSSYVHKRTESDGSGTHLMVGGWANLVDSAEHLGQGKHVRTRQEKNKHNKHCEPTHPPVGACGKFLKFCELLRPNFLSKLRHWLSPSSTSSPQFTRCSIFAVLATSLTFTTFVTFPKFPLEGVETRHVLYRFRSFHISCDLRHLLLDTNPTLL